MGNSGGKTYEKHGMAGTKTYRTWKNLCCRVRGTGPKRTYEVYMGLECDFLSDFEGFLAEVGVAPSDAHQIDRIDNDRGYVRGNIRWATRAENMANKSNTNRVEYKGERIRLIELWERLGKPVIYQTFKSRYNTGKSIEECCSQEKNRAGRPRKKV